MPKKIGITGGIGAGKSTVTKILQAMEYPVFYSDEVAKQILNCDLDVRSELTNLFGISLYDDMGINRKKLAEIIFNDSTAREKVNQLIHPRVRNAFDLFVHECDAELIFNEAAILFETGSYKQFDATILIVAPLDMRVNRIMKRDGSTAREITARINAQWSDEEKLKLADFSILNDERKPLISQVEDLIPKLIN